MARNIASITQTSDVGREEAGNLELCWQEELQEIQAAFCNQKSEKEEIEPLVSWQEEPQGIRDRTPLSSQRAVESEEVALKEQYDRGYSDGVKSREWDIFQRYNQGLQDGIKVGKELGSKEMVEKMREWRKKA